MRFAAERKLFFWKETSWLRKYFGIISDCFAFALHTLILKTNPIPKRWRWWPWWQKNAISDGCSTVLIISYCQMMLINVILVISSWNQFNSELLIIVLWNWCWQWWLHWRQPALILRYCPCHWGSRGGFLCPEYFSRLFEPVTCKKQGFRQRVVGLY